MKALPPKRQPSSNTWELPVARFKKLNLAPVNLSGTRNIAGKRKTSPDKQQTN